MEKKVVVIPALHTDYCVQRFHAHYYQQVVDVFTQSFCEAEPMTKYIDMQHHEFRPFAQAVVKKALQDNLSSIIVHQETDEVVALALVEDLTNPFIPAIELTKKFDPIFSLLEQLTAKYFRQNPPEKNHIAHLFITAVAKKYRGKRLSTQVNFHAMHLAAEANFKMMMSELTNYLNEKGILHYLNGEKIRVGEIIYNQFKYQQTHPFQHLSGEAHAFLWKLPEIIKFIKI